ncbi:MAG: hypothetical protein HQM13_02845 [SAR324 cluster bacterium]|nr:hypothetical protein [SAR324 cluster bacterium]
MSEFDLDEILEPFEKGNLFQAPKDAFKARKNTFFNLEIPYSHVMLFSSIEYENGVFAIRKALSLPYFHTMGANGKSVFVEINGVKRLVVGFLLEYQIEDYLEHYGHMLHSYLTMADTIRTEF